MKTSYLSQYTQYPFVLMISQRTTEEVLEAQLQGLGVTILRPEKALDLRCADNGNLEVTFESGKNISAQYVVAADGAKSTVSVILCGHACPSSHCYVRFAKQLE
jgi:2-polyprenyl-6-methoxyphenol hydroxylase-like FAD-dependent oxidoreductase